MGKTDNSPNLFKMNLLKSERQYLNLIIFLNDVVPMPMMRL